MKSIPACAPRWGAEVCGLPGPDRREIYRYLGQQPGSPAPSAELDALVEDCVAQLLAAARPRTVYSAPLELVRENGLYLGGTELSGKDIKLHLEHCTHAVLLAVTLGVQTDALIRRTEAVDMARAVVLDAASSVLVEQLAADAEEELRGQLARAGRYLTGRYSPGYGDLPLTLQRDVLRLTDAGRRIGLAVTASGIMTPRKSITAVLGVADIPVKGHLAGCGHCVLRSTCIFRKRGQNCGV